MNARSLILLVVLALSVGIVAGCGDDDSSGSASAGGAGSGMEVETSSLGKEEFIKQASKACTKERKGLLQEANKYLVANGKDGKSEEVLFAGMVHEVLLPTIEAEIAAIRELGAPEGDEEEIEAILVAQQRGVDEVEQLNKLESLDEAEDHFAPATKMLYDYGFWACTNSPRP